MVLYGTISGSTKNLSNRDSLKIHFLKWFFKEPIMVPQMKKWFFVEPQSLLRNHLRTIMFLCVRVQFKITFQAIAKGFGRACVISKP